ncbi:MAG: hypothetical protein GOVbin631_46 [Prokaryotic dsDNA virus sp.]|nr:MAG: hypothetical protein GOVbin631_46 [Prokaryotic dsDNA virus sp.]|tara:strand:- start:18056 stop:18340 length:285 start_codon:yes stop_codon:yes gene_type:complete
MKLAAVPVEDTSNWPFEPIDGTVGLTNTAVINGSLVALRGISGKLTKEQVEVMAEAAFDYSQGEGCFKTRSQNTKDICIAEMLHAIQSIGLGVE